MDFWKVIVIILSVITILSLCAASTMGIVMYMHLSNENSDVIDKADTEFGGGIIHIKPETDKAEQTDPIYTQTDIEAAKPDFDADDIVGNWSTARRDGDIIETEYYTFNSDGTYQASGAEFMHTSKAPDLFGGYDAEGWEPVPMGYPYEYGTYTVKDGIIEMISYGTDVEEYEEPYEYRMKVNGYYGSYAMFDNRKFLKDFKFDDIEELCKALNVDIMP